MKGKAKRVLLITSKKSERLEGYLFSKLRVRGYSFDLLEMRDIYYLSQRDLMDRIKPIINSYDIVILPGNIAGDFSKFSKKVVKGTEVPFYLHEYLRYKKPEELSQGLPAEKAFPDITRLIASKALKEASSNYKYAYKVRGLKIPYKPPPLLVFSEIFPRDGLDMLDKARYFLRSGADALVVSYNPNLNSSELRDILKRLRQETKKPIGLDAPIHVMKELYDYVDILLSFDTLSVKQNAKWIKDKVSVVLFDDISKIDELVKVARTDRLKIIVDPVAYPPIYPGALETFLRAKKIARRYKVPIMLGLLNITELADVDSSGLNGFAAFLAAEAGISIILIGEESVKSRGSVYETRIASDMSSVSLKLGKPPKDIGLDLLAVKEKNWAHDNIVRGNGEVVWIKVNGEDIEVNCRQECPLDVFERIEGLSTKEVFSISIMIYRYCSPWSKDWKCL
ncbi:MAG: hypothetical protein F7B61_03630 [Caldisphaeraceae archaeon]|nr:hypothetical protein [Caldisphaeraceae archaeon]